jgi:hypothetical protein
VPVPFPSLLTVTVCSTAGVFAMVIDSSFLSLPTLLMARTVNVAVSSVVGVPLISPVVIFSVKPSGSSPLKSSHRMKPPPFA